MSTFIALTSNFTNYKVLLVIITIMNERLTSQKLVILNYLKNTKSHPGAEDVYREIRRILPKISLGTIYRILDVLKSKSSIIELPGNIKRFDGNTSDHSHFICLSCNSIHDIKNENNHKIPKKNEYGLVKFFNISLYGTCNKCTNNK